MSACLPVCLDGLPALFCANYYRLLFKCFLVAATNITNFNNMMGGMRHESFLIIEMSMLPTSHDILSTMRIGAWTTIFVQPRNTNLRAMLSTVDLLIEVPCIVKKALTILHYQKQII